MPLHYSFGFHDMIQEGGSADPYGTSLDPPPSLQITVPSVFSLNLLDKIKIFENSLEKFNSKIEAHAILAQ